MLRWVKPLLKYGWQALFAWATFLGFANMPSDTAGLIDLYPWLGKVGAMVDRETLLFSALFLACCWITWIDARPFVMRWIEKKNKKLSLKIFSDENFPCGQVDFFQDKNGHSLAQTTERIGVINNTGKPLHSVKLRIERISHHNKTSISIDSHLPAPMRPFNRTDVGNITLHDGETEYWDIAKHSETFDRKDNGIFICCLEENKRHNIPVGMYKVDVAVYSEEWPKAEESFFMGVDTIFILLQWDEWLRKDRSIHPLAVLTGTQWPQGTEQKTQP